MKSRLLQRADPRLLRVFLSLRCDYVQVFFERVVKFSHGEEMYVFVRQYQKSLDSVRVKVGLNSTDHL